MAEDPNGWVKNPPSTFVRVQGTSRETLNGQMGLVLQYLDDRARYMVLLCENQQSPVALKAENLAVCSGMIDKGKCYFQMLQHNPQVRQQFQLVQTQVKARLGLDAHYVLALLLMSLMVGWYAIGFTKVVMLLTIVITILTIVGPDLAAGKDLRTCVSNAPVRWRTVVREQVPVVGPRIAAHPWYLRVFTTLIVSFVLYSLIATPKQGRRTITPASLSSSSTSSLVPPTSVSAVELDKYYKLGFDDATSGQEFGASLPKREDAVLPVDNTINNDEGNTAASDRGYTSWRRAVGWRPEEEDHFSNAAYDPVPRKKASPLNMSSAFAAFTLYRILHPIAMNAEGRFDLPLLRANVSNLEVYKLGILAFSVYRLVSAFL